MYDENIPTVLRNETAINNLPDEFYSKETQTKIPDDCR